MGRSRRIGAGLLLLVLLVPAAGCAQEGEQSRVLDIPGSAGSAGSAGSSGPPADGRANAGSPAASPVPGIELPAPRGSRVEEQTFGVHALALPRRPKTRLVAETLVEYTRLRVEAYHTGRLDGTAMGRVARGSAMTGVRDWVPVLRQRGHRTVGHMWLEVEEGDVRRRRRRATFTGVCAANSTVDVDGRGIAVEDARSSFTVSGSAYRVARATWMIESVRFEPVSCRPAP